MKDDETRSDRIYRELQSKREENTPSKKRRYSRIIMILDAVVILVILIIIQNRTSEKEYRSSMINLNGLETRFSLVEIKETKTYAFTLSFKGLKKTFNPRRTDGNLGLLVISDSDTPVISKEIGEGTKEIRVSKDEVRSFRLNIKMSELDKYLKEKKKLKRKRRSIINLTSQTYPFRASMRINLKEPVLIPIEFNHEVGI